MPAPTDADRLPDQAGLSRYRYSVEAQGAFVVGILCKPTEGEPFLGETPAASRAVRRDDNQEAGAVGIDAS